MMRRWMLCAGLLSLVATTAYGQRLTQDRPVGAIETVFDFTGPMPTGVTVAKNGRIFVCYPRWGDPVDFTVAELRGGRAVPFPDAAINRPNPSDPANSLVSVQSVVVDPKNRLWIVDTGSI